MAKKPKPSHQPTGTLPKTNISSVPTELHISYRYLCLDNKKYSLDSITDNRERIRLENALLSKLQEYCELDNFKLKLSDKNYKKHNHIHPINWKDPQIREENFTSIDDETMKQIKDECWQLGIDNNTFRIHGFFIDNVFYVVWLDPKHQLYPTK